MPYRRLPNTDSARHKAMEVALRKSDGLSPFQLPFSVSTFQELKYFLPEFKQALTYQRETLDRQTEKQLKHQESVKKARLFVSHFIQVLNFSITRGETKADSRLMFGLGLDDRKVPSLNSEKDIAIWGKRVIEGEQQRMLKGLTPITNPNAARVKVHYEEFMRSHQAQKHLQDAHNNATKKISDIRRRADEIILKVWNEVEDKFNHLSPEEKRRQSSEIGVVYVFRKHEKLQFDNLKLNMA